MRELEGLTPKELSELLGGSGRAKAVWRMLASGGDPGSDPKVSAPTRERLRGLTRRSCLEIERRDVASCGTTKLRLGLADDKRVETVLIPSERRSTVCVSTQAGCARGCVFCVTATMGLERGLTAGEIVSQVILAIREAVSSSRPPVRNVVFMGMGEPLDNLDAVERAVSILCAPEAFALGSTHITLSTVGTSPEAIRRTSRLPVQLAWSLHAVDDGLRRRLVPTTRHSMSALRQAFVDRCEDSGRSLFVEMTLMDRVNDAPRHADALCEFLAPFPGVRVNLLPMNTGRSGLSASPEDRTLAFRERVRARGLFCTIRRPRGLDKSAACGQLAVL